MAQRPQDFMRVGGGISPDLILQDDGNHLQNLPQRNVMSDPETTVPVTLTVATEKYGQLEEQLKDYADVWSDSIVVSGFMNKADFSALWNHIWTHNISLVLNLEGVTMENNEVPDHALFMTGQFGSEIWPRIRRIMLPEGIKRIGTAAFACLHLQQVNIPSSVREIGASAFAYDNSLDCPIVIPEGVEEIKSYTFHYCHRLRTAPVLPQSLKKIGAAAFSYTDFDGMVFPSGLVSIGEVAFLRNGLSEIRLPESCTEIGSSAFENSYKVKEIILPESLDEIPWSAFYMCDNLEYISIPGNIKTIGEAAFECCFKLKRVDFSEGITEIGKDAFSLCAIDSLCIPATVLSIGDGCFTNNDGLKAVCSKAENPPMIDSGSVAFDAVGATLYVPVGSKEKYIGQSGWNVFAKVQEQNFESSGVDGVTAGSAADSDAAVYDLTGRRVDTPQSGRIYIVKGRKVLF